MTAHATGTFRVQSWDEETYDEIKGGAGLARVITTQAFTGDVQGEATVRYLMVYTSNNAATFVGLQRIVGLLGGRSGSFVLQVSGTYSDGKVQAIWSVVPNSGTDELQGLTGTGGYPPHGEGEVPYTLDYDFGQP